MIFYTKQLIWTVLCPQNSYTKIPTNNVMVLGGKVRPLGGNRARGWSFHDWDWCSNEKGKLWPLLFMGEYNEKTAL